MGALISFELAREIRRQGGAAPVRLLVSGHRAPHLPDPHPRVHDLPGGQFVEKLRALDATPAEVLENDEFMALLEGTIRADFELCDTYSYRPEPPLACPISAFGGESDREVTRDEVSAWREHTSCDFTMAMLPGSHLFIHSAESQLIGEIRNALTHDIAIR
jgi:medium-chain acyl-[acyl-carrier-protein] hydrolase